HVLGARPREPADPGRPGDEDGRRPPRRGRAQPAAADVRAGRGEQGRHGGGDAPMSRLRRHPPRVWLVWAAGLALLLCTRLAPAAPGVLRLALDPELVACLVLGGAALLRASMTGAFAAALARLPRPTAPRRTPPRPRR